MEFVPLGLTLMLMMPVAAKAAAISDRRWVIIFGFRVTGFGLYRVASICLGVSFHDMMLLRLFQMAGRHFTFVNDSTLNYVGVPPDKHNQVSGMANFSRNLGGSVGIPLLNTLCRAPAASPAVNMFCSPTPHESILPAATQCADEVSSGGTGFTHAVSQHKALEQLSAMIAQQATAVSYVNAFLGHGIGRCLPYSLSSLTSETDP